MLVTLSATLRDFEETHMVRLRRLFSVGIGMLLLGACDQGPENPETAGTITQDEIPVLPGTESSRDFGEYVVHFNALTTDQLTQDIAQQYDIVRSDSRAMLNVSILQKRDADTNAPVPGSVTTQAINLTGQLKDLPMREIREGDAIYYIGETAVSDGETLVFTIDVTPINDPSRYTVRFKKQFFVD